MSETTEQKDQNWLIRLKEESWEAELLISTVAIFGTIQLFKLIDGATILAIDKLPPSQYIIGYWIVSLGLIAVSILTTMFITHFLLRAYWVGLVGLNSVFPDYGLQDSAYSEIYTRKILSILPKLKKTISDVDELSSVIFSAAFFMLIINGYMSLTVCAGLILFNLLSPYVSQYILLLPLLILGIMYLGLIIISVLANIKKFKQNEKIQHWYFLGVKWSSLLMLGPLYKFLLQISMTFASNYKKKKSLIVLTFTIAIFGFILADHQFEKSNIPYLLNHKLAFDATRTNSNFYANQSKEYVFLVAPQIDEDIVTTDILKLFIPIFSYEKNWYNELCGPKPEKVEERPQWYLDCYSSYHEVFLNGEKINAPFLKQERPETGQFGIIVYLDLVNAKRGNNIIKVVKKIENPLEWEVPFQWVGRDKGPGI